MLRKDGIPIANVFPENLNALTDVDINNPSNKQILRFDESIEKWINDTGPLTTVATRISTLDAFVNLMNKSGNSRGFCGCVQIQSDIGLGFTGWTRVIALAQNAANNADYDIGLFCIFLPANTTDPIRYALIMGKTDGNYTVDKTGTICFGDDYLPITGGTIKAASGNTIVVIEGATSSEYGQLQLKRGGFAARLTAANNLTNNRDIALPNVGGNVVVSSNYGTAYTATGSGSTLSNYETWKSLFNRVRTGSFSGPIRRSQLLVSSFDGQANVIFSCQRYQSQNYSIWGSFRGSSTAMIWYIIGFSSSGSVSVYKHTITTSSGLTVTNLSDNPAAVESSGAITPATITII